MKRRRASLLIALLVALGAIGGNAGHAQTTVDSSLVEDAGAALRDDPVYVHPDADFEASDAEELRQRITEADAGAVYIAVLPERASLEAGGDAGELLRMIAEELGRDGTYAAVVGEELWAGATPNGTPFEQGTVPRLADETVAANDGPDADAATVLFDFVGRLGEAAAGGGSSDGGSAGFSWLPLLLIAGGIGLFSLSRRRRRDREEQAQLEEVREVAMDDLVALGEDLQALDLDVEMPGADPRAKQEYVRALGCYERATGDLDKARRPADLEGVTSALEEGRFAMASAKARLEGHEPPDRRQPCFFDPRHGPSATDVEWAPPGGAPRAVPACAADARRIEKGDEPLVREITVGGRRRPYWDAPAYYGPWAGGYFGGFGLFEGMLLGSILSGGWGGFGGGFGGGHDGGDDGGDFGGGFGGGDFGGFGGGDFGGGGFGGGDFGGGGFGGGD
ncbi:hypothetical protein BH24ACT26_BH24ACT26_22480 [soil metagenome]